MDLNGDQLVNESDVESETLCVRESVTPTLTGKSTFTTSSLSQRALARLTRRGKKGSTEIEAFRDEQTVRSR